MNRKEQEAKAVELGIVLDKRWGDSRLAEEIEKAKSQEAKSLPETFSGQGARQTESVNYAQKETRVKKLFPVKLLRNYRPMNPDAVEILVEDDNWRALSEEEAMKIKAGETIRVPVEEAQHIVKNKIAERNDPIA